MKYETRIDRARSSFLLPLTSKDAIDNFFEKQTFGFVLCGRSNVGKSSFINRLLKNSLARTSNTPGKTREINTYKFFLKDSDTEYFMFDLPGFGHASVSKQMKWEWDQLMDYFLMNVPPSVKIIHVMDSRHPFEKVDLSFSDYCDQERVDRIFLFNKFDKLKKQKDKAEFKNKVKDANRTYFTISAETGHGFKELEQYFLNLLNSLGAPA